DRLEQRDLVAKFHTGATERSERARIRFSSNPSDFDDLAAMRPALKIDCAHFMGPNHIAMAPVLDKNPNIRADLSGLIENYDDNAPGSYTSFVRYRLADAIMYLPGVEQFLFGSDYPFCDQGDVLRFVESLFDEYEFTPKNREDIMYNNAARLYGFTHG
ncbi:MAG: amidohydrolase family protein, partial [Chitinivibrionales bacterium]|nr:amidohydrolase family protein [Chitinivibrionales bacterium]